MLDTRYTETSLKIVYIVNYSVRSREILTETTRKRVQQLKKVMFFGTWTKT